MAVNYTEEEEATAASANFLVQNNSASKNIFLSWKEYTFFSESTQLTTAIKKKPATEKV